MKWILKALFQKSISPFEKSTKLNLFFQKKVYKNLPLKVNDFILDKGNCAVEHFKSYKKYLDKDCQPIFFEFGAGYDLAIPLLYNSLGIKKQIVVDIRENYDIKLINDSVRKINDNIDVLNSNYKIDFKKSKIQNINNLIELKKYFGIDFKAPYDARNTQLENKSIDFCSNTATLEHIPEKDIEKIFIELYRIMKPEGIISCMVDMKDHYSYFDKNISIYNYLKFSDKTWKLVNPDIMYQNRMRYPNYIKIFEKTGFEILEVKKDYPTDDELSILNNLDYQKCLYCDEITLEEIAIKSFHIILRKK